MDSIIEQLNANLKIVYRQALDADKKLDELQQQGHGKFKALFTADSGFTFEAKRFKPYVLDVAADGQLTDLPLAQTRRNFGLSGIRDEGPTKGEALKDQ